MTEFISFHGDQSLRIDFLRQLRRQYDLGELRQGTNGAFFGGSWHGSSITCELRCFDRMDALEPRITSSDDDIPELAARLNVPRYFVLLDSWVFENLRAEKTAHAWPLGLYAHLPAGVPMFDFMSILRDEISRAVPPGLFALLRQYFWDPNSVPDEAWYPYRHGDGLGIPAAQAVAAAVLASIELHLIRNPPLLSFEKPSLYAQLADEMLRKVTLSDIP